MRERWGSHWRWRLLFVIVSIALVGYGWVLADRWRMRVVLPGSDGPAFLALYRRTGVSVEAYDWKAGKRWHVADVHREDDRGRIVTSLRGVGNGRAVAWHDHSMVHVVDVAPPCEHRRYNTTVDSSTDELVGMSDDRRFAVFQRNVERIVGAAIATQQALQIVDLTTGEVVNTKEWESTLTANGASGTFLSQRQTPNPVDSNEPVAALWIVSSDGKWEQIEDRDPRFAIGSNLSLACDPKGKWRLLGPKETARTDETPSTGILVKSSPDGGHALLFDQTVPCILLLNTKTLAIRELARTYTTIGIGEFVDDGKQLLLANLRDDLLLVDVETGRQTVLDEAGSQRRNRIFAVGGALLLMAVFLLGLAIWERQLPWTVTDLVAAGGSIEMALGFVAVGMIHPELQSVYPASQWWVVPILCGALGIHFGMATMVGVYWSFGRSWLLRRWLLGGLCLLLFALPIAITMVEIENLGALPIVVGVMMAFGLIFVGAVNAQGLIVRALGWTIRDVPVEENRRQFGLVTFFWVVAAIAVLVTVAKWLFAGPAVTMILVLAVFGIVIISSGLILAGILFSAAKTQYVGGAAMLFLLIVAGSIYLHGEYPGVPFSRMQVYVLDIPAALLAAVTIAVPCMILRSRGWRWR